MMAFRSSENVTPGPELIDRSYRKRLPRRTVFQDHLAFEVRFSNGRASIYFCWDDIASRRLSVDQMTSEQALEAG